MEQREIKFRFWSEEEKTMICWDDVASSKIGMMLGGNKGKNKKWEVIPMQFTGLHDKNGKEIYEGDIIKFKKEPKYKSTWEVRWRNCGFSLVDGIGYRNFESDNFPKVSEDGEIIGNIYETPNLLPS